MICELANTLEMKISKEFDTLRGGLEQCQIERDKIAHGIWLKASDGTIVLRVTSGTWQPVKNMKGKEKRLIKPEGIIFGADQFMKATDLLIATRNAALAFAVQIKEATADIRKKI